METSDIAPEFRLPDMPADGRLSDDLNPKTTDPAAFWWVNNKQTYAHEISGNYLWSPTHRSDGGRSEFYENMKRIRPGDVVFAFAGGAIKAVGMCSSPAIYAPKPDEFGSSGDAWGDEGWRVPVAFTPLSNPMRPKDHMNILAKTLPPKYSPIRANGHGNQGAYLSAVPLPMAEAIIGLLGSDWKEIDTRRGQLSLELEGATEQSEAQIEREIQNRTDIGETEKVQLVRSRRGQGTYRKNLEGFESECRLTGVKNPKHLRASHMKPWRASNNFEKLDGNNGLLLSPHIDHLFDQGYISFADHGTLLISPEADIDTLLLWGISPEFRGQPFREAQLPYLKFHRDFVFKH